MIQRGDIVRKTERGVDYYGTARTAESGRLGVRVRVEWHPDFGTWEEPGALTVVSSFELYGRKESA